MKKGKRNMKTEKARLKEKDWKRKTGSLKEKKKKRFIKN